MAMLFYPVDMSVFKGPNKDPKFKERIQEVQKRMGVPATGILLSQQFETLRNAAATIEEQKVYPPPGW